NNGSDLSTRINRTDLKMRFDREVVDIHFRFWRDEELILVLSILKKNGLSVPVGNFSGRQLDRCTSRLASIDAKCLLLGEKLSGLLSLVQPRLPAQYRPPELPDSFC